MEQINDLFIGVGILSLYNIFASLTTCNFFGVSTAIMLYPRLLLVMLNKLLRKYIWRSASLKKVPTLNTVTSLTVNSIIFLQISQSFQNTVLLNHLQGAHFFNEYNKNTGFVRQYILLKTPRI